MSCFYFYPEYEVVIYRKSADSGLEVVFITVPAIMKQCGEWEKIIMCPSKLKHPKQTVT